MFLRPAATPVAVICAALLFPLAASAQAQRRPPPPPVGTPPPPAETAPAAPGAADREALRKELLEELESRLDTVKEDIRDEVRAAVTSANAAQAWEEEFEETQPELEFLELHGYLRTRMELFDKFHLGHDPELGPTIFPTDPADAGGDTYAFADMRLRVEPTLNISEEVRIHAQIDMLDNLVLGSTPQLGRRTEFSVLSETQEPPQYGFNSFTDSIVVKRAWAEVRTPLGELRFGRMGTHWGLGILANDGNCLDCDHGDTVDRILFATKIADHVIAPAIDFVSEGVTSGVPGDPVPTAQPFDRTQLDDARDYVLAIARKDDAEEIRKRRLAGQDTFINYGLYFIYRTQAWDAPELDAITQPDTVPGNAFVPRDAWAVIPDLWFRLLHKKYRLELEVVTVQGEIGNRALAGADVAASQSLDLEQYGAVLQNELLLLDDDLALGLEIGFASGDPAPGFGNFPGSAGSGAGGETRRGDWEGPQYRCLTPRCADGSIENFRFDRDYHVDMILFREILGGVTDATYVKPSLRYEVTEGLGLNLAIIYSQANQTGTTPTGDRPLGLELNAGVLYASDDGFVAGVRYGVLFPLSGLEQIDPTITDPTAAGDAETAQAVRGIFAVTY